jgi:hypothetical protein
MRYSSPKKSDLEALPSLSQHFVLAAQMWIDEICTMTIRLCIEQSQNPRSLLSNLMATRHFALSLTPIDKNTNFHT